MRSDGPHGDGQHQLADDGAGVADGLPAFHLHVEAFQSVGQSALLGIEDVADFQLVHAALEAGPDEQRHAALPVGNEFARLFAAGDAFDPQTVSPLERTDQLGRHLAAVFVDDGDLEQLILRLPTQQLSARDPENADEDQRKRHQGDQRPPVSREQPQILLGDLPSTHRSIP